MTGKEFIGRAQALVPAVRTRARQAEQLRRLPEETFREFQDAGLFRALQPARFGGFELDPGSFYEAVIDWHGVRLKRLGAGRAWRASMAYRVVSPACARGGLGPRARAVRDLLAIRVHPQPEISARRAEAMGAWLLAWRTKTPSCSERSEEPQTRGETV